MESPIAKFAIGESIVAKIKGGYYIKARQIQDSEIAHSPPHFREIWDWLIKEANHKDKKVNICICA